jgi:hypothetical protein
MIAPATSGLMVISEVENSDLAVGACVVAQELARYGEGVAVEYADRRLL